VQLSVGRRRFPESREGDPQSGAFRSPEVVGS
jgi:hypothetical protein